MGWWSKQRELIKGSLGKRLSGQRLWKSWRAISDEEKEEA